MGPSHYLYIISPYLLNPYIPFTCVSSPAPPEKEKRHNKMLWRTQGGKSWNLALHA